MKKVIVFDVEKVMFNDVNVERWERKNEGMKENDGVEYVRRRKEYLKGSVRKMKMYDDVKENMERLMGLKGIVEGMRVYVLSGYDRIDVMGLMEVNGLKVDGVYRDMESLRKNESFEDGDMVYFGKEEKGCMNELWGRIGLRMGERKESVRRDDSEDESSASASASDADEMIDSDMIPMAVPFGMTYRYMGA